jgi:hypothetical protein
MGDPVKRQKLHGLATQHRESSSVLQKALSLAKDDLAFRKQLLESPAATLKAKFPKADASVAKFISTLDSTQFEGAMRHRSEELDAEANEAEAEAEAEA